MVGSSSAWSFLGCGIMVSAERAKIVEPIGFGQMLSARPADDVIGEGGAVDTARH